MPRLRRDLVDNPHPEAPGEGRSMTLAHENHAEFRSTLGKFTLEAVFTVPATGITMLFGPSGCGKTTVLGCIAGLIHIKDGLYDIAREVWQDRKRRLRSHPQAGAGLCLSGGEPVSPYLRVKKSALWRCEQKA
jgi:energy-coupling factor transporter ATP-binding protein EcfA2